MKQKIEVELFKEGDDSGVVLCQGSRMNCPEPPFPVFDIDKNIICECIDMSWNDGVCSAVIELDEQIVSTGMFVDGQDFNLNELVIVPKRSDYLRIQ